MAVLIDHESCNGCGGVPEPPCAAICPGDLIGYDGVAQKPYVREPGDCWDCMACVKACPRGALESRLPFCIAGYGASLKARIYPDRVLWRLVDPEGRLEEYSIPTIRSRQRGVEA